MINFERNENSVDIKVLLWSIVIALLSYPIGKAMEGCSGENEEKGFDGTDGY